MFSSDASDMNADIPKPQYVDGCFDVVKAGFGAQGNMSIQENLAMKYSSMEQCSQTFCNQSSAEEIADLLSDTAVYHDESDSEYLPDSASLSSESIEESDGEDPLHCLLPPLHPDLIDGPLSLIEGPIDDSEELLEEMRQNPSIIAQRREFLMPSHETERNARQNGPASDRDRTAGDKGCAIM
eukprot:280150-Hanusia_phi.AAC.1